MWLLGKAALLALFDGRRQVHAEGSFVHVVSIESMFRYEAMKLMRKSAKECATVYRVRVEGGIRAEAILEQHSNCIIIVAFGDLPPCVEKWKQNKTGTGCEATYSSAYVSGFQDAYFLMDYSSQ